MKSLAALALTVLFIAASLSAGCASSENAQQPDQTRAPATVPATPLPVLTYAGHDFTFKYPGDLAITETAGPGIAGGGFDGQIILQGASADNITVAWAAMAHRPPDIPALYESMRSDFQNDPKYTDLQYYLLETYPSATCGDATMIGHMSYRNKARQNTTNEGIILWYHAKQDRIYLIDISSVQDYKPYVRDLLDGIQQTFRCTDG